ncbi:MAG: serine/threonine protein kinase, partial [Planctomycetes bacterium]|nr:serine/threonine protein kinase [Planctomycetota bacterium]
MVDETLKSPEGDDRSHGRSSSFSSRTTPRAVPPVDLPEGSPRHLGHFRLIRVLGRGGMGVVYLASDEQLDRLVAVKVLPFHRAHDAETVARFEREALAVTELAHPSIVPIYHVGEDAGNRFFVMRYVDGEPLNDYAARVMSLGSKEIAGEPRQHGRSTTWRSALGLVRTTLRHRSADLSISLAGLADILRVVEQTARALDHAHQHGIVHRDVKPSNVMIDQDGQALLLDFGLARFESEGQGELTRSGDVLGTVSYMAPEQLSDKFGGIDGRTDIYGLGVTLFECLTARRPFEGGSSEAVIYQTLTREAPSPRDFVPELSRDLSTITLKCLEKNKERRYQSG